MRPILQFKYTKATPVSRELVVLEWELELVSMDLAAYRFRILRGRVDQPDMEVLVDNLATTVKAFDHTAPYLDRKLVEDAYVVELYNPTSGLMVLRSSEFSVAHDYDIIATAIINKASLILSNEAKGIGVRAHLFSLRNWGVRCPACWDDTKSKIKLSNCEVCYGTSFRDGYYKPIPMWINVSPEQSDERVVELGETTKSFVQAWTLPAPTIRPADVIVLDRTDKRYRVVNQRTTVRRGAELRQMLTLTEINRTSSVEYKLVI